MRDVLEASGVYRGHLPEVAGQEILRARDTQAGTGHEMKSTPSCNAMRAKGETTVGCGQHPALSTRRTAPSRDKGAELLPSPPPSPSEALPKTAPWGAPPEGGSLRGTAVAASPPPPPCSTLEGPHLPGGPHPAGSPISISPPSSPLTPSSRPVASVRRVQPGARLAAEAGPVPWLLPASINNQQPGRLRAGGADPVPGLVPGELPARKAPGPVPPQGCSWRRGRWASFPPQDLWRGAGDAERLSGCAGKEKRGRWSSKSIPIAVLGQRDVCRVAFDVSLVLWPRDFSPDTGVSRCSVPS